MNNGPVGGGALCQVPKDDAAGSGATAQSASGSAKNIAAAVKAVLLNKQQAAAQLGISVRLFEQLRGERWMPRPFVLGQRVLRWSSAELEQAIAELPRQAEPEAEPAKLRRGKIERMKACGVAA